MFQKDMPQGLPFSFIECYAKMARRLSVSAIYSYYVGKLQGTIFQCKEYEGVSFLSKMVNKRVRGWT